MTSWALHFLGVGSAMSRDLGASAGVIERDGEPLLMIDCGDSALLAYLQRYGAPPHALFLTHAHLDHVSGMERLFAELYFDPTRRRSTRLYMHAALLPVLQSRLADYPEVIAEGGANFWDAFHLIPVHRGFWHAGLYFDVFPVRHHAPDSAFGLGLPGSMVWTGDTRPIPEMLARHAAGGELVAHDCALVGNPSHTGLDDLAREYPADLRAQLVLYHYGSAADGEQLSAAGYQVARSGETFALQAPTAAPAG